MLNMVINTVAESGIPVKDLMQSLVNTKKDTKNYCVKIHLGPTL